MKSKRLHYFLSLRWKFILALVSMLLLVSVVIGLLGVHRFGQQLDNVVEQQHDYLWRDYHVRLRSEEKRLTAFSQEMLLMMGDDSHQLELGRMDRMLDDSWADFELYWGLKSLQVFNDALDMLLVYGNGGITADGWLQESFRTGEPINRVRCSEQCFIDVAVPVLVDDEINSLVFTTGFEEVLAQLTENHQVEVAMLGQEIAGSHSPWQRPFLSLTNRGENMHRLGEASALVGLSELLESPGQLELGQEDWVFFSWIVADTGERILLFRNINDLVSSEEAFVSDLMGILLLAMMLAGALGIALFWRPLARIRRLGQSLPLLAQSRFDDLRERLQRDRGRFRDELVQLESTTLDVANQLERLESDVDRYTNELQRMAMMDALTGLPNRAMFHHELAKSLGSIGRTDEQIALLFLDLDEFKRVNDTLGHDVGDELLKTVANRLQKSVRSMDTVCRLGGDEFTVIVRGLESESDIHRIIHQIFTTLQQPLQLGRHTLIITTSIGVVFCDNPMARPEELLKRADLAMYQAKQAGRSNYRVFNEQMLESASRKLMLEQDIRTALNERQLYLAMQPILDLAQNRVVGFEGLVRWQHPTRGLVMPGEFIKEIEGSEQSIELAHYVIEMAFEMLGRFSRKLESDQFYVSVNLSPSQYLQTELVAFLQLQLEKHQVDPRRIVLELTEEVLIKNLDKAMHIMHQLKSMGIKIAIDDFGTGYSSLSYLKQLPFDLLKVDRGFVSDLDNSDVDRNIVTSVIELAHNLKRTVIAEGVESHDQRQFLLQAKCDCVQGFLYSAALDEQRIMALLERLGPDLEWHDEERLLGRQAR
ncbi:bifunctional diguanylate cyclase/phosphodiesterase [Ferrimonas pelagia]|uniref:EAL domain-containing protein n=1 Tax=Ferrimonas pelagia TaxID=1177826 RepID=A0ABP9EC73_9GAMM